MLDPRSPRARARLASTGLLVVMVGVAAPARAESSPEPASSTSSPSQPAAPRSSPDEYQPQIVGEGSGWKLTVPVEVAGRAEAVSAFPVDAAGHDFSNGVALSPRLRVGARLETVKPLGDAVMLFGEYEQDLPTGTWTSRDPIAGDGMPNSDSIDTRLRKGWGRVSFGRHLHVGGGFMTSHWGLGLVANDGAHGWRPGSAAFTDPRGGDLVLRGFVATGPLTDAHLFALLAVDQVRRDETLLDGDSARQFVGSVLIGYEQPVQAGFFMVRRHQTTADGSTLDVTVIDPAGKAELALDALGATLGLEAEGALVMGHTTLGATPEIPQSNVRQVGGALRSSLAFERVGGVLDLTYASGDASLHDSKLTGFKADPAFESGLLLFRYVGAAQSARAVATASDPMLAARPPGGIERIPTRGSVTDALVLFPRLWVRPLPALEAYGGALFAFAPAKPVDPLNSDLVGGAPRNALGGEPGGYLGTELDLGARYRLYLHHTELELGAEGGLLLPGSALRDAAGSTPPAVYGGRLLLGYRL
ncbi:MAG: hypothetical protein OZ921_06470 [Sorangiineae bacterium]|nr:hypothetical protein [Polyangiaceae bacterium]MEB2322138.1 hypothetical protein [Sorangiineae bacterium]